MASMGYCRFQSAESALREIADGYGEFTKELSEDEHNARAKIIMIMIRALQECDHEIDARYANKEIKRLK